MSDNARLMVDLSSNNSLPNLPRHFKAGYRTLALKATEGTTYTWDAHGRLADEWHRLGGQVWHYHFARPGAAAAQAERFLAVVAGHWKPSDRLVLDVEVDGVTPQGVVAFISRCNRDRPGWHGLVYSYASFLTEHKIRPACGWGLWLAAYGKVQPPPVPGWSRLDAWQHTDSASVPGIPGRVDQSVLIDILAPRVKRTKPAKPHRLGWLMRRRLVRVAQLADRKNPVTDQADRVILHEAVAAISHAQQIKEKP